MNAPLRTVIAIIPLKYFPLRLGLQLSTFNSTVFQALLLQVVDIQPLPRPKLISNRSFEFVEIIPRASVAVIGISVNTLEFSSLILSLPVFSTIRVHIACFE